VAEADEKPVARIVALAAIDRRDEVIRRLPAGEGAVVAADAAAGDGVVVDAACDGGKMARTYRLAAPGSIVNASTYSFFST
jgi:hypothetical protein